MPTRSRCICGCCILAGTKNLSPRKFPLCKSQQTLYECQILKVDHLPCRSQRKRPVVVKGIFRRIVVSDPSERVSLANNHGLRSQEGLILAVFLFTPPSPRFQQISAGRAKERTAKSRDKFPAGKNRPNGLEALKQDVPSDVAYHKQSFIVKF
jgi:hypothetical protein